MNTHIFTLLFPCLLILSPLLVRGETHESQEVHVLVKVHSVKETEAKLGVTVELENESLSQVLSGLSSEDEVLLKGELSYQPTRSENKIEMKPKFRIKSIHPVSLKRLGVGDVKIQDPPMQFSAHPPTDLKTIPVSKEVASAITLTASVLLLQDLSSAAATQPVKHQMDQAVFFSAGALATGYFIWKQLSEKKR